MRLRSALALPALLAYVLATGLAVSIGCAGGKPLNTGNAGSAGPGTAGSAGPGTAGSAGPGTPGSAGSGVAGSGVAGSGVAGTGGPGVAGTGGGPGAAGMGGGGPAGMGGRGGSSGSGSAGVTGTSGTGAPSDAGVDMMCQTATIVYEPKIPTVYLVVDRSGSMFHCLASSQPVCANRADTSWSQLKTAVQAVVTQLEGQVRFGFTTIYGTDQSMNRGGMCPLINGTLADHVPPQLNNAAKIKTTYDGLAWPLESESSTSGKKFESPASYAIAATTRALMAFTPPGDKYILFITDGQEDFCDDALEICASDSTVGALQAAFAANIRTIVFGLQTAQFNLPPGVLQAFANAGAGEPTVPSLAAGLDLNALFDQCQGVAPWRADLVATGKPNMRPSTVGNYAATMGPTMPFKPNAADQNMLVSQLTTALAGVKSCTFDLNDAGGKTIKVEPTKLDQARVSIEGTLVPQDATNGWSLGATTSELVFNGTACTTWRMPNNKVIDLNFPCGIIIFE